MKSLALLLSIAFSTLPFNAAGDEMRCGTSLVKPGDTKVDVLERCGQPKLKEVISGADERKVEQWMFKANDTEFARVLTFEGIKLVRVETLTK